MSVVSMVWYQIEQADGQVEMMLVLPEGQATNNPGIWFEAGRPRRTEMLAVILPLMSLGEKHGRVVDRLGFQGPWGVWGAHRKRFT